MTLYKRSQKGLYLGRIERSNQNLVITEAVSIFKVHTVRDVVLTKARMLENVKCAQ